MKAGVDAAIVSDLGAICVLREQVPELPLHVSTQASTVNAPAVRQYRAMGCERVILAREMSLARIAALHQEVGDEHSTGNLCAWCVLRGVVGKMSAQCGADRTQR